MIIGVTGNPGNGKTLRLVWLIWQLVMARVRVFTNIELTDKCPFQNMVARLDEPGKNGEPMPWPVFAVIDRPWPGYWPCRFDTRTGKPIQWYRAFWHFVPRGCAVVISEASDYFDSMEFASLPKACRDYWPQHRKCGHRVILDFQKIDNLYNRVRRVIETFMVCEHNARGHWLWRHLPIEWSRFVADSFCHERFESKFLVESGFIGYREAMPMFQWYRSEQFYGNFAEQMRMEQGYGNGIASGVGGEQAGRLSEGIRNDADGSQAALVDQMGSRITGDLARV